MARTAAKYPACPQCGAGGTDGHGHSRLTRLYRRGSRSGPFVGVGWLCPNGHFFLDDAAPDVPPPFTFRNRNSDQGCLRCGHLPRWHEGNRCRACARKNARPGADPHHAYADPADPAAWREVHEQVLATVRATRPQLPAIDAWGELRTLRDQ